MNDRLLESVRGLAFFNLHRAEDAIAVPVVMADSFIAIHRYSETGEGDLVYISPIAYGATSPSFDCISVPITAEDVATLLMVVKLYVRRSSDWTLLMVLKLNLAKLVVVSPDTSSVKNHINSFVVKDRNGLTYTFQKYVKKSIASKSRTSDTNIVRAYSRSLHPSKSYTFTLLRSLGHLVRSINEITATKARLLKEINAFPLPDVLECRPSPDQLQYEIEKLHNDTIKVKLTNDKLGSEVYNLRFKLKLVRQLVESRANDESMFLIENELFESLVSSIVHNLYDSVFPQTVLRLVEKCTQLSKIIPIDPNSKGNFTILSLDFPASTTALLDICYNSNQWEKIEQINVALGYIVMYMQQLANLVCLRFKYPLHYIGNQYYVSDVESRRYPLFYDVGRRRRRNTDVRDLSFEQAISLLNKNLIILISEYIDLWNRYQLPQREANQLDHVDATSGNQSHVSQPPQLLRNIPFECLDNFLWSLKYLILMVTAPSS